jgi:hypothetical protein
LPAVKLKPPLPPLSTLRFRYWHEEHENRLKRPKIKIEKYPDIFPVLREFDPGLFSSLYETRETARPVASCLLIGLDWGPLPVGWVERSETHHGLSSAAPLVVGFAALNPPYKNWMPIDEIYSL